MKTLRRWTLTTLCAAACGIAPFATADTPVADSKEETSKDGARWTSARESVEGPVLDSAWFAERRAIVYLVPDGGLPTVRGPAAAVFEDRWTAGDWSIKHVFVSDVPSKFKFVAGRRIGIVDMATAITKAAGQGDDQIAANEEFLSQHVYFVHDPEGTTWSELLGTPDGGKHATTMVLLENGKVVRSIELPEYGGGSDAEVARREATEAEIKAEVRRVLAQRG